MTQSVRLTDGQLADLAAAYDLLTRVTWGHSLVCGCELCRARTAAFAEAEFRVVRGVEFDPEKMDVSPLD